MAVNMAPFTLAQMMVCVWGGFAPHFVTADEQPRSDLFADIMKASEKCHPKIPPLPISTHAATIAITSPQSKYVLICCLALTNYLISNYLLPSEPVNLNWK